MQPNYQSFAAGNSAMCSAQDAYDNALPPEDPPEPPNLDNERDELMVGSDTELLGYDAFKRCADEELYDLVPDGFCVDLILAASRCSDPFMRDRAKAARTALEDHATKMLHDALERRNSRG